MSPRSVEADLALGEHGELIGELERFVHEPLRERLRAQLMLALYRSGRQVEALELYRETRRVWSEELGIEPGAALRDLEAAILRQDEELELPEAAARAQEPDQEHSEPRRSVPPETEQAAGAAQSGSLARKTVTLVLAEAGLRALRTDPRPRGSPADRRALFQDCLAGVSRSTAQAWNDRSATTSRRSSASRDCTRRCPSCRACGARAASGGTPERGARAGASSRDRRSHRDRHRGGPRERPGIARGLVSGEALGRATRLAQAAGPERS